MRLSAKLLNRPALQAQTAGLSSLGKPNLLVVTVDALYKASHTATEINNFVQGGGSVVLVCFSNVFHAKIIGASMCRFGTMFNATTGATEWIMDVDANGTATFSDVVLASLKNPNAITFTGAVEATYDGSQAVEVKIPDGSPSDWSQSDPSASDYVKNRTHYIEKAFEDITWDGDTEGRDIGYINDKNIFYKVSDQTPSVEDLIGATKTTTYGITSELNESQIKQDSDDIIVFEGNGGVVVLAPTTYRGTVFPSTGVYFLLNYGTYHITELKAKETVHKLDKKFLPDDIGGVTDGEMLDLLIETDTLPAMQDADGSILADENNNILLW